MFWKGFFTILVTATLILVVAAGGFSEENPKYVALTFDDGPTPKVTENLVEGLKARYIHGTFFLCGYRMAEYPEAVKILAESGQELGIHTYSHAFLQNLSPKEVEKELKSSMELLHQLTDQQTALFRAPGGLVSETVSQESKKLGLSMIFWSVDPVDWKPCNPQTLTNYLVSNIQDGDIVLLHDLHQSTVDGVLSAIDILEQQGFQFVTVTELAKLRGQVLEPGQGYWQLP